MQFSKLQVCQQSRLDINLAFKSILYLSAEVEEAIAELEKLLMT